MNRRLRLRLFPWITVYFAGRELYLLGHSRRPYGAHVFAVAFVAALVVWWHMDVEDDRHLAREELACEEDPKRLLNSDVGLAHHPGTRNALATCFAVMGVGLLVNGFETYNWGFLFLGAALASAGGILWALF